MRRAVILVATALCTGVEALSNATCPKRARRLPKERTMTGANDPKTNQLLAGVPLTEWQRWLPQLEPVDLPLGRVLYESGAALSHAYFPTSAIVSLLYVMESGASAEIAVVGKEGVVGVALFMGGETTPSRAVVQSAGRGFRLSASALKQEFSRSNAVLQIGRAHV